MTRQYPTTRFGRPLLAALLVLPLGLAAEAGTAPDGLQFEEAKDFSFRSLIQRAQAKAQEPYSEPPRPAPEVVERIGYSEHGQLRFDPELAPHAEGPGAYPVTFFHLGNFFPKAVQMYLVRDGQAQRVVYSPDYFEMPDDHPARELPADAGFAGFRYQEANSREDWRTQDWVAFLGASYFRTIGALGQYGLSARGIAIDTAASDAEEFPDFVKFFIESPEREHAPVVVHALLDGPSITGAYRFVMTRGEGVVMEVDKHLFLREEVERFGVAPLTSMFWYGEYGRRYREDWRPEVHDSDGLQIRTGGGERIWRPLNNPPHVVTSSFLDESPRGFGLMQRDRDPDHYLDGVRYEDRPSLWVEPLGDWGPGAVQLVEIPTDDEIHDNIVAFWVPEAPAEAGRSFNFSYRLHWLADEPHPTQTLAQSVATRKGRGGRAGTNRPEGVTKFVVEFEGGPLSELARDAEVEVVADSSSGEISYIYAAPIRDTGRWRAHFDLETADESPVELRLYLRHDDRPLTETWLYQLHKPGRG